MTVTTERLRTQKASSLVNLDTYTTGEERLIFSKADGDKPYVGRVYRASPLVGSGSEFSNVVFNLLKSLPDDSIVQVALLCAPDHDAASVYGKNKDFGDGACNDLIGRQQELLAEALEAGWKTDLPALNKRQVIISVAMPIPHVGPAAIEEAKQLQAEFLSNIKGCGFHDAVALAAPEVVGLYRQYANIYRKPEQVLLDEQVDIRYQIFGPNETFDFRDRRVGVFSGDTYCTAVTIKSFPQQPNHGLMNLVAGAPLNLGPTQDGGGQRIPGPYILCTTLRVANQRKEGERVTRAIESRSEKGGKPRKELPFKLGDEDPSARLGDLQVLQRQCAKDGNKYVYVSMVAFLFGKTRDESIASASKIAGTLGQLKFDARHVTVNGLVRWAQTLPLNFSPKIANQLQCEAVMSAHAAGCLFPVYGDYLGNAGANSTYTGLGLITRRGSLYSFDPFVTNTNSSGVLGAASGSGKTAFLQAFALSQLAEGSHVFALDSGQGMRKLCEALNGEYNEFGAQAGFRPSLNPFTGLTDDEFDEQQETITSLMLQMAFDGEAVAPGANIALSEAVKATWAKYQDTAAISHVVDSLKMVMEGNTETSVKGEVVIAAANLIPRLKAFIDSPSRGQYFRGPGTLNPKNRFVVFELGGLTGDPHLRKCVLFFLLNMLLTRIRSIRGRKLILVDEAHDLLKDPAAAHVMEGIYLKCRKDNVSTWITLQSLHKLVSESAAGAVILNMAAWKIVLAQEPEEIEKLIAEKVIVAFQNDPYFARLLRSVKSSKNEYSEALIFGNGSYEVGRLYLDKVMATLFSSEGDARFGVFALMDQGMTALDAVRQVLGDTRFSRRTWLQSVVAQLKGDEGLSASQILQEFKELV